MSSLSTRKDVPNWVAQILESGWLWMLARIIGTFMFWYAGLGFLLDQETARAVMTAQGMEPAALLAIVVPLVQVIGAALIIFDFYLWLGAGMLGVFTLLTIPLVHDFWNMTGGEAIAAKLESEEHVTVVGLLIAISIASHLRRRWLAV